MNDLVLVGGGGHAKACLDVIRARGGYRLAGIVELPGFAATAVLDVPVIGTDEDLPGLIDRGFNFLVAVGQIETPEPRIRLFTKLRELGAILPTIISPTACVSSNAVIGQGSVVMHMAIVGPGAQVGANCILNTRALVEHDAHVGDHCHLATAAVVNGGCVIGAGSFIGSGAVLRHGVRIGERAVIGMGEIVRHDVAAGSLFRDERESSRQS